ncbi:polysaccharide deacetylase family protein [Rhizobium paknamense]|uniref:Chitooligosaccharide deacetylase n=1 Tax=Rhizobium paknamense TaxID=1206817 RepID=A0ABU0I9J3_9HYPH|nr:polysaccharide deacetylase family protein [Rhizobium paknamense]MDQ0454130.1 peptidoglycan/xylan/chitin deacetylase (PgdA/CDA1 family) [Rhizobium paknamense]
MLLRLFAAASVVLSLSACAGGQAKPKLSAQTAFAPAAEPHAPLKADDPVPMEPRKWTGEAKKPNTLAGRTLIVSSLKDLKLQPKEVALTFDDGPAPKKTDRILAILDQYQVKATFLMLGEMAKAHPDLAKLVVQDGHEAGSHTFHHHDLKAMAFEQAMQEIDMGRDAVKQATGAQEVGFFRFPYLSDTPQLRHALAARSTVVLDVDIDTKDYFKNDPSQVLDRAMTELNKKQGGIILMHDIHARTITMLPLLLDRLAAEGYTVVTLHYQRPSAPPEVAGHS